MNYDMDDKTLYKSSYLSPIGVLQILCDKEYLLALSFNDNKELVNIKEDNNLQIIVDIKKWLDDYFMGKNPNKGNIKVRLIGTEFQKEVWNILESISYGESTSYGDIARKIAEKKEINKMSCQAVGHAIHMNPIAMIIPCHRVLGSNGELTGYRFGLDRKKYLLDLENIKYQR